jgi:hypothetical protein
MRGHRDRLVYVIRNGSLAGNWEAVPRRITSVARRALDSLIEAQGMNDLYRIEVAAREDHEEFHYALIGADFEYPHKGEFDSEYIRRLYAYAFNLAAKGYLWQRELPGMTQSQMTDLVGSHPTALSHASSR